MQDYQQRVIDDKKEIDVKLEVLRVFTRGDTFSALPKEEQDRMSRQGWAMENYSDILGDRIKSFKEGE